jgi:hypothetical protein
MMTKRFDNSKKFALSIVLTSLTLGGCSTMTTAPTNCSPSCIAEEIKQQQAIVESKNEEIALLKARLVKEEEKQTRLRSTSRTTRMTTGASSQHGLSAVPKNARPGECYARVSIPAKYKTETKRVLKRDTYTRKQNIKPAQYAWQEKRVLITEAGERVETIPAKYDWENKRVLIKEAGERFETIPAKYEWVTERVLFKESSERIKTIPAKYKWVTERVLVNEPGERIKTIPAKYAFVNKKVLIQEKVTAVKTIPISYKTVKERVIDKPAHTVWKKGSGLISKITRRDEKTGEILCLVEVPATYKSITKQVINRAETTRTVVVSPARYKTVRTRVLKKPATTRTINIPAKYKTVRKQVLKTAAQVRKTKIPAEYKTMRKRVLKTPAQTRKVTIPAKYKAVRMKVLKTPAQTRKVEIPAQYKTIRVKVQTAPAETRDTQVPAIYGTVSTRVKVSESELVWRPVLCKTNMTQENIKRLQVALRRAGFNPWRVDGVIGSRTLFAVKKYQRAKGLPMGGITIETLDALNVKVTK